MGVEADGQRVARCLVPNSRSVASAWCPAWSRGSGWPQPDCSMDLSMPAERQQVLLMVGTEMDRTALPSSLNVLHDNLSLCSSLLPARLWCWASL